MIGKVKLKLNQKASVYNNRYEIFVDGNFIGAIDYRNPKVDFVTDFGNHKILLKAKDYEKEHHFNLNARKSVVAIDLNENIFWSKANKKMPKYLRTILMASLGVYLLVISFLILTNQIAFRFPLLIPFFILFVINAFGQNNRKFELRFR